MLNGSFVYEIDLQPYLCSCDSSSIRESVVLVSPPVATEWQSKMHLMVESFKAISRNSELKALG